MNIKEFLTIAALAMTSCGVITNANSDYVIDDEGITVSDNFEIGNTNGDFLIDDDGIQLSIGSSLTGPNAIRWRDSLPSGTLRASMLADLDTDTFIFNAQNGWNLQLNASGGGDVQIGTLGPIEIASLGNHVELDGVSIRAEAPIRLLRLTNTGIGNISSPDEGMIVYSTTIEDPVFYDGTNWRSIIDGDTI